VDSALSFSPLVTLVNYIVSKQILRCFLSGDHSVQCKAYFVVYVTCGPCPPALLLVPTNWNVYSAVSLKRLLASAPCRMIDV